MSCVYEVRGSGGAEFVSVSRGIAQVECDGDLLSGGDDVAFAPGKGCFQVVACEGDGVLCGPQWLAAVGQSGADGAVRGVCGAVQVQA